MTRTPRIVSHERSSQHTCIPSPLAGEGEGEGEMALFHPHPHPLPSRERGSPSAVIEEVHG